MSVNYRTDTREDTIDSEEQKLYDLIMEYRVQNGLGTIELSKALTIVASRHALDTVYNVGTYAGHAWSDAPYDSSDSSTYPNMWEQPQRLETGYTGYGFEITAGYSGTAVAQLDYTAEQALAGWQGSTPHNNVLLNKDIWASSEWNAIGVSLHKGIAHVWFGREADPTGQPLREGAASPFQATQGNDRFVSTSGNDAVDGGAGVDTLVVAANRSDATIQKSGTSGSVASISSGTDTFNNLERIEFNDGTLALDIDGIAGAAYRIYKAAFARTPDEPGLKYWITEMDNGTTLYNVAQGFVHSNEFQSVYGANPTNEGVVQKFYQNVLGREGETGGVNYWTGELDSGSKNVSQVLAGFSESPENISGVAPIISDGIFFA